MRKLELRLSNCTLLYYKPSIVSKSRMYCVVQKVEFFSENELFTSKKCQNVWTEAISSQFLEIGIIKK